MYGQIEEASMNRTIDSGMLAKQQIMDRTIGQNIEAQIAQHKREIIRLEGIASQMQAGASMLDLRIEDLRRVMQY